MCAIFIVEIELEFETVYLRRGTDVFVISLKCAFPLRQPAQCRLPNLFESFVSVLQS